MKKENTSVDQALKHGRNTVNLPVIGILFVGFLVFIVCTTQLENKGLAAGIGLPVVFITPLVYWSIAATRWRIWAFTNVRNVHELEHRAVKAKIIGRRDSWTEKLEIRSAEQKAQWQRLLDKFNVPDEFHDDKGVPFETVIYFSKGQKIFQILMGVLFIAMGIFLAIPAKKDIFGWISIAFGIFFAGKALRDYFNNDPQLVLNEKGLKKKKGEFTGWQHISGEDVIMKRRGKHMQQLLVFRTQGIYHEIQVFELDKKGSELEKLLRIYRGRFEENQKAPSTETDTYRF
ncbi:hypothetical protein HUK80_09430 [Flavobacterium sp. MAH-1]|uniref:Uncharacterized protein n=1 Tax=Flavobacterium agri TaxID=2743471 RepID=A0A7Y8Y1Z5_9FLAO|nr:hypothetical protein [Flavobacterium agri]NUY81115.1 hypothetical protein [Flavobacterium agri]NYA71139.1 hypothetical protein [Flavobacterium agri]